MHILLEESRLLVYRALCESKQSRKCVNPKVKNRMGTNLRVEGNQLSMDGFQNRNKCQADDEGSWQGDLLH